MTYQEFKQHIVTDLQRELSPAAKISIQDIIKNNDTHLDGLTVFSEGCNISPTIYLNYYYRQYEKGRPLPEIYSDIRNTYQENSPNTNIDISFFTVYDKVKSRVIFKLVNYSYNRELLQNVPHFRFLDLAIVFHCLVKTDEAGTATILIQNRHLSLWDITGDDLYALAMANTPRLLPYDLRNMTDVLKELLCEEPQFPEEFSSREAFPMYLLSNRLKLHGAVCMLYPNLLSGFSKRLGCDLYLVPSSVHEVLIIPANQKGTYEELSDMVREVNATQLSREEILSDHVYYFSVETGKLTLS